MNDNDDREEDVETCQKVNHGSDWDVCPMRAQRVIKLISVQILRCAMKKAEFL